MKFRFKSKQAKEKLCDNSDWKFWDHVVLQSILIQLKGTQVHTEGAFYHN